MGNLIKAYLEANQGAKASLLVREFIAVQRNHFPQSDPTFAGLLAQVAFELLKGNQFADAETLLRECLAIREKTQPDVWSTFNTRSLLGGALCGQREFADAEPLLLAGYEGMKEREATIPEQALIRLPEALERLVQFYEVTDKPEEAAKWRQELEANKAATAQTLEPDANR